MPDARAFGANKSTNVRTFIADTGLRTLLAGLGRAWPSAAATVAERVFFTPPAPPRAASLPRGGTPFRVTAGGTEVAAWRWGSGPAVVLVHGWGGRAAQLSPFVQPLTARGFSVLAFDAPGHGSTSQGRSSVIHFARALRAAAETVGGPHAVIGHSLGAAAAAFAVHEGLRPARLALIAAASHPAVWTSAFALRLGLTDDVIRRMRARSEKRLGFRWSDLAMSELLRGFQGELFVVHDRDDREVPWTEGRTVADAVDGSQLLITGGLGHRRVLRAPEVVARTVAFVAAAGATAPQEACEACGRPVQPPHAVCAGCLLERSLFNPHLRGARARTA